MPTSKMTIATAFAVAMSLTFATPALAVTPKERADQALSWIQTFECPELGAPLLLPRMQDSAQARQVKAENWQFVEGRERALQEAYRAKSVIDAEVARDGGKPGRRLRKAYAELDASIAETSSKSINALVQWALANWAETSHIKLDELYYPLTRHPLSNYKNDVARLAPLKSKFGNDVGIIEQRMNHCLADFNEQYILSRQEDIEEIVATAKKSSEIGGPLKFIEGYPLPPDSEAEALVLNAQTAYRSMVIDEQRQIELARARAQRDANDQLKAQSNRNLSIAIQYVRAINNGNLSGASGYLSSNVFLQSPNGNANGKNAVSRRMRSAAKEGNRASLAKPIMNQSLQIYSNITSNKGRGRMIFSFSGGKISRIKLIRL
ncbi:hypothetical protein [Parasphingorhabdus flavimaris]|uniref:hypothetical protein n=1 Tax=Parasphingorhabdus flavimaris TaxID=266812 RepID=UPI003003840C